MDSATQTAVPGIRWDAVTTATQIEGGDLQALRGQNRVSVLHLLHDYPTGASMSDIHYGTALSRPTVKLALGDLIERGLVTEGEIGSSTARGGRPGRRYRVNTRLGVIAGAVIGLEHVDVAVADAHGTVVARSSSPRENSRSVRDQIMAELRQLLSRDELETTDVRFLTIGVIGIVEPGGRVHRNGDFAEISEEQYFDPIRTEFGCEVLVDNDANLAAMAEFANLARTDVTDMIGLHADVAIGCGLVLDSKLHRGYAGAAGELGFHPLLGWRDSHEALQEEARSHGSSVAGLFRDAGAGVDWAAAAVGRFAHTVGPGVLALVVALNPQVIVIGGAVCEAHEAFRDPLRALIAQHAPAPPEIVFSELGSDCILLGAIGGSISALWEDLRTRAYGEDTSNHSPSANARA